MIEGEPSEGRNKPSGDVVRSDGTSALGSDLTQIVEDLTLALLLEADKPLQDRLTGESAVPRFSLKMPRGHVWLEVGGGESAQVARSARDGLPAISLSHALEHDPGLTAALREADRRTGSTLAATRLVDAVLSSARLPDRAAVARLSKWSPVIEISAYSASARALTLLDMVRAEIIASVDLRDQATRHARRRYWSLTTLIARLTLLAADVGASAWLVDMSRSFVWDRWTPSRPLTRERSLWLTAIAARSAAAFGAGVIEAYLERLDRMRHPTDALDCLIGCTSIGMRDPAVTYMVIERLTASKATLSRRDVMMPEYIESAYGQALAMLREPEAAITAARHAHGSSWSSNSSDSGASSLQLGRRVEMLADPANVTATGAILGLTVVPLAIALPPESFFAPVMKDQPGRHMGLQDHEIRGLVGRAWTSPGPRTHATLQ